MVDGIKMNEKETRTSMSRRTALSTMGALSIFGIDFFFSYSWASIGLDQTLEDLLVDKATLTKMWVLRRILNPMGTVDAIEFLKKNMNIRY